VFYLGKLVCRSSNFRYYAQDTVLHQTLAGDWYKSDIDSVFQNHRTLSSVPSHPSRTNHPELSGCKNEFIKFKQRKLKL